MKNILSVFISIILFLPGCKKDYTVEITHTAIPSDTVLFNYVLGERKEKVDLFTDSLISKKLISPYTTHVYTISRMGFSEKFKVEGYPCELFLDEDSIKAIMKLSFYNDTLIRQEFFINNSIPYLQLKKLYGNPSSIGNYPAEHKVYLKVFWRLDNKAIYISDIGGYNSLFFEKIDLKIRQNKEEKSILEEKKQKEKTSNKEKSDNMGW